MSEANFFASILDEAPTEVTRTLPLPVGTYVVQIQPFQFPTKPNQPGRFPLKAISALADVDEEDLEEVGGCDGKLLSYNIWPDERAREALDTIHEAAGLDLSQLGDVPRSVRNEQIVGQTILAAVKHRMDKNDSSKVYAEVGKIASAE